MAVPQEAPAQVLDKQKQLEAQTFWDNRDWDWYAAQIPFFECPDADITTTYYHRWELLTKHLTYGSPNERDWVVIDFGVARTFHTVKLYPLDDSRGKDSAVRTPQWIELEAWIDNNRRPIKSQSTVPEQPQGHRANDVRFDPIEAAGLRVTLHHRPDGKSGLSEIEAWGDARLPLEAAPPPAGNLAYNPKPEGYPRASASFTDRFGGKPGSAIDGKSVFLPSPMNRWTSYESKSQTDWLEIDFGRRVEFRRVELAIYDDRGGVQPPTAHQPHVSVQLFATPGFSRNGH
jgi:hypothetical protein